MGDSKVHADDTLVPVLAPATAKPNWDVCGRMFAMIARPVVWRHRQFGLRTRRIVEESIRTGISPILKACYRQTGMLGSTAYTRVCPSCRS
jgi:hypothetical protein